MQGGRGEGQGRGRRPSRPREALGREGESGGPPPPPRAVGGVHLRHLPADLLRPGPAGDAHAGAQRPHGPRVRPVQGALLPARHPAAPPGHPQQAQETPVRPVPGVLLPGGQPGQAPRAQAPQPAEKKRRRKRRSGQAFESEKGRSGAGFQPAPATVEDVPVRELGRCPGREPRTCSADGPGSGGAVREAKVRRPKTFPLSEQPRSSRCSSVRDAGVSSSGRHGRELGRGPEQRGTGGRRRAGGGGGGGRSGGGGHVVVRPVRQAVPAEAPPGAPRADAQRRAALRVPAVRRGLRAARQPGEPHAHALQPQALPVRHVPQGLHHALLHDQARVQARAAAPVPPLRPLPPDLRHPRPARPPLPRPRREKGPGGPGPGPGSSPLLHQRGRRRSRGQGDGSGWQKGQRSEGGAPRPEVQGGAEDPETEGAAPEGEGTGGFKERAWRW